VAMTLFDRSSSFCTRPCPMPLHRTVTDRGGQAASQNSRAASLCGLPLVCVGCCQGCCARRPLTQLHRRSCSCSLKNGSTRSPLPAASCNDHALACNWGHWQWQWQPCITAASLLTRDRCDTTSR
jgi:hypothetical protein